MSLLVRLRRLKSFWEAKGTGAVIKLVRTKLGDAIAGRPVLNPLHEEKVLAEGGKFSAHDLAVLVSVNTLVSDRFRSSRPLQTYSIPQPDLRRVTLVTDSIGSGSLFGGVGTALIFAALLANRSNATLRVLTRTEAAVPDNVAQIFRVYGIELVHEMQFGQAPVEGNDIGVDLQPEEIVMTTSWWSTAAALPGVPARSIIYLLQEDERMFYPYGDDFLRCSEVLNNREITLVINTRLLYDHLIATGLEHLATHALWFEPSFPPTVFHPRPREPGRKRRLFFYARPNNLRNLFYLGIEVIDRAIYSGVLDLDQWDVCMVGSGIPGIVLGDGYEPLRLEGLGWQDYADLVGTVDLGLSLMYTPHPSYPPLDLASSGAVVVTNCFGIKTELSRYSRNIICAEPEIDALVAALQQGIALVEDEETVRLNFEGNAFEKDWHKSFAPVFDGLEAMP